MGNHFRGVFPPEYKFSLKDSECLILNTDSYETGGKHWIGLYQYKGKTYFYDSYNRDYKTLNPLWRKYKWENPKHQLMESNIAKNCGQLSLASLVTMHLYSPPLFFYAFR